MKNQLLLVAFLLFSKFGFSQAPTVIKFKSETTRKLQREKITDTFTIKDYSMYHLIVYDAINRKIVVYGTGEQKGHTYDIINAPGEEKWGENSSNFPMDCIDMHGENCKINIVTNNNKPFVLRISYSLYQMAYFIYSSEAN